MLLRQLLAVVLRREHHLLAHQVGERDVRGVAAIGAEHGVLRFGLEFDLLEQGGEGTPSQVLSYLLQVVTQWMSLTSVVVPSALNCSQVKLFSSSTRPHTWKRHESRSIRGMEPCNAGPASPW